jgi:hypothetical protein
MMHGDTRLGLSIFGLACKAALRQAIVDERAEHHDYIRRVGGWTWSDQR